MCIEIICLVCDGKGYIDMKPCPYCNGKGIGEYIEQDGILVLKNNKDENENNK